MCTSIDTAARAIDAMLHRGYAEERDGGVWVDDLGARELADPGLFFDEDGDTWRDAAKYWEGEHDRVERLNDDLIVDRDSAYEALHDIMRLVGIAWHKSLPVGTAPDLPDHPVIENIMAVLEEWRDGVGS